MNAKTTILRTSRRNAYVRTFFCVREYGHRGAALVGVCGGRVKPPAKKIVSPIYQLLIYLWPMFTFDQRGLITMTAVGFCLLRIMPIYPCFQGLISSKILICEENVTGKKKVSFFLEP